MKLFFKKLSILVFVVFCVFSCKRDFLEGGVHSISVKMGVAISENRTVGSERTIDVLFDSNVPRSIMVSIADITFWGSAKNGNEHLKGKIFVLNARKEFVLKVKTDKGDVKYLVNVKKRRSDITSVTVKFNVGEEALPIEDKIVDIGGTISPPIAVSRNYTFVGWYITSKLENEFNFSKPINQDITLYAKWEAKQRLQDIISKGKIPIKSELQTNYDEMSNRILGIYAKENTVISISARYITKYGAGVKDGKSWGAAYDKTQIKNAIDNITNATEDNIYLILINPGEFQIPSPIAMKDNVAIIGGWTTAGNLNKNTQPTILKTKGGNAIIKNQDISNKAQICYLTIENALTVMINNQSSPTIKNITFQNNKNTSSEGGAMRNINNSKPIIKECKFINNISVSSGGAIYNQNSVVTIENSIFRNNRAVVNGGAMYNDFSTVNCTNVVFTQNKSGDITSLGKGGAIYNNETKINLINSIFFQNISIDSGGAIYNTESSIFSVGSNFIENESMKGNGGALAIKQQDPKDKEYFVNSIIWGNTSANNGNQMYIDNSFATLRAIFLQYCIIDTSNAEVNTTIGGRNVLVASSNNASDPFLRSLSNNGGKIITMDHIGRNNAIIDGGIYVKKHNNVIYFSIDNSSWHSSFDNSGLTNPVSPPDKSAIDCTAKDARGYLRVNRPDIGSFELGALMQL